MIDWKGVDVRNCTVEERFWAKVQKTDDCWLWTGATMSSGYGQIRIGGRAMLAHRVGYELLVGPIPNGLHIDHRTTCPKNCVNPAHLRPVTRKQNQENRVGATRNSTSGYRGVTWFPRDQKWKAQVHHNGRGHTAGYFDTAEEAAEAARLKRIELFTHNDVDLGWRDLGAVDADGVQ